ncbi:MAG: hypothetical protein BM555_00580 [Crocinitomix sp. MedPE-SWsnd]|mgnify:CR=1 FL=1|jgi:hypothetical protein|nr:MAG: hypothetical protein BM555_00580 [Crocinitomix sp. MedPE-SWsnd]
MKKDINIPTVENISVAVIKEMNEEKTAEVYNVYLINQKDTLIKNAMVSSKGYGENKTTGEKVKTSALRHFIGDIDGKDFAKIEPIVEDVFGLNNEYWVSFYQGSQVYDKKFIFLAETICEENMINVPVLNKRGVLI